MQRSALTLCLLLAVCGLAACNLPTNVSGVSSARTPLPSLTPSVTAVVLDLAGSAATTTPTPSDSGEAIASTGWTSSGSAGSGAVTSSGTTSGGTAAAVDVPPCFVRTGWPYYTVVHGDTLSSIARRTGSTTAVLATANCLNDPNRLEPGQLLSVPTLPLPPTAFPPQYPLPGEYGSLTAAPLYNVEAMPGGGTRLIVGGRTTITVRWLNFPPGNLTQAEIVYIPANDTLPAVSLGIDTNLADGISAVWTVPGNAEGRLLASAPLPGQNHEFVYSPEVWVRAEMPTPAPTALPASGTYGTLRLTPALGTEPFDGTTRYRVQAGDNVSVSWEGFPAGLLQIEIVYIPLDQTKPAVSLGIDQNPADGIALAWSIPPGANGHLLASSRLATGNHAFVYSPEIWVIDVNAALP